MSILKKAQTRFVLDASVTSRWALSDGSLADLRYADVVLSSLTNASALVPSLWFTELAHVLGGAVKRQLISFEHCEKSLERFNKLPIVLDDANPAQSQVKLVKLMLQLNASAYDSEYLQLASRLGLPLATLDLDLRKAAKKLGLQLYLI